MTAPIAVYAVTMKKNEGRRRPERSSGVRARLLSLGMATTILLACAREPATPPVHRADAEATALAKVPGGTIVKTDLEEEDGRLVWSFDIATPGTRDITEVQVDAKTSRSSTAVHGR